MAETKPRLIEFMTRGIDLARAQEILERWEFLTAEEKEAIGFISFPSLSSAPPRSTQGGTKPKLTVVPPSR